MVTGCIRHFDFHPSILYPGSLLNSLTSSKSILLDVLHRYSFHLQYHGQIMVVGPFLRDGFCFFIFMLYIARVFSTMLNSGTRPSKFQAAGGTFPVPSHSLQFPPATKALQGLPRSRRGCLVSPDTRPPRHTQHGWSHPHHTWLPS